MKKSTIILIVVIAIVGILLLSVVGSYNSLVTSREMVNGQYAAIDVQLTRRAELIPNLVATVKGFNIQEQAIIDSVTNARAKIGSGNSQERFDSENELSSSLSRLLVIAEAYPEIKSDANFRQLMDELSGTENRISVARKDYNDAVRTYNTKIKTFPSSIFAGIFGFTPSVYFEAPAGADQVPTVDFTP